MADEAFALSPISARAAQPREEDYDAISEAFMETSRGRWFLGEYAKRNRNADTHMVLDAVARIEQSLAAQKQPEPEPVPDTRLADALAAIKAALGEARSAASTAVESLALEQHLAPVRKGARVIREISWRWREIGADGRICDMLDSQVSAIEASCRDISSVDPQPALDAAFALLGNSIATFDESEEAHGNAPVEAAVEMAAESSVESASPEPSPDAMAADVTAQQLESTAETEAAAPTQLAPAPAVSVQSLPVQALPTEEAVLPTEEPLATSESVADADVMEAASEAADATAQATAVIADPVAEDATETAEMTAEAADAHDEAVLDMIAAEMAAYDPSDEDGEADIDDDEMQRADPPAAGPETIAPAMEEISEEVADEGISEPTSVAPEIAPAIEQAAAQLALEPEPSLGATLIANGLLRKPAPSRPDPLAAIRRLSQIEKIALFS